MVNGKNVSMFTSYPHSAAWELANAFSALLFERPFGTLHRTDEEAARVQADAMVRVLRLVGETEEAQGSQGRDREPRKLPVDWLEEADRVERFTQRGEWHALIDWAHEMRRRLDQSH